jgi:hypothetical protein
MYLHVIRRINKWRLAAVNQQLENFMKPAIKSQLVLALFMLSLAAARTAPAAEPTGDAQEQARLLLAGKSFPVSGAKSRSAALPSAAANTAALDSQEQARRMIVGRPVAKTSAASVQANGSRAMGTPRDRRVGDALESARRMILGQESKAYRGAV